MSLNNSYNKTAIVISLLLIIVIFHFPIYGLNKQDSIPTEYEVRAAFLFNFIKFVEWPEEVFKDSLSPIILGIIGHDPFGKSIDTMIKDRTIQSRKIIIKRFPGIEDYEQCHVLYVGFNEKRYQVAVLKPLEGTPVLTVGDLDDFIRLGGMINFIITGNQVGFEINLDAVEKSRLEISAKLLKLARLKHD
jgi:hypothetical protein